LQTDTNKSHGFSEEALKLMTEYDWPDNVRELQHVVECTRAMSIGPVLHMADLPKQLHDFRAQRRAADLSAASASGDGSKSGILPIADMEKVAILETIQQLKGDKLAAARLLGIGKTTLYRKLKEYGLADASKSMGN
jgi:DNA-binding NtrC family response regulator